MNRAERRAAWWYRLRGWRILGANVWAGGNELDLIVRRGRQLRFVEVKEKRGPRYGDPHEAVTEEKQRRVARAADTWLASHPECDGLAIGFDTAIDSQTTYMRTFGLHDKRGATNVSNAGPGPG